MESAVGASPSVALSVVHYEKHILVIVKIVSLCLVCQGPVLVAQMLATLLKLSREAGLHRPISEGITSFFFALSPYFFDFCRSNSLVSRAACLRTVRLAAFIY
jgi:hypothetical protein